MLRGKWGSPTGFEVCSLRVNITNSFKINRCCWTG